MRMFPKLLSYASPQLKSALSALDLSLLGLFEKVNGSLARALQVECRPFFEARYAKWCTLKVLMGPKDAVRMCRSELNRHIRPFCELLDSIPAEMNSETLWIFQRFYQAIRSVFFSDHRISNRWKGMFLLYRSFAYFSPEAAQQFGRQILPLSVPDGFSSKELPSLVRKVLEEWDQQMDLCHQEFLRALACHMHVSLVNPHRFNSVLSLLSKLPYAISHLETEHPGLVPLLKRYLQLLLSDPAQCALLLSGDPVFLEKQGIVTRELKHASLEAKWVDLPEGTSTPHVSALAFLNHLRRLYAMQLDFQIQPAIELLSEVLGLLQLRYEDMRTSFAQLRQALTDSHPGLSSAFKRLIEEPLLRKTLGDFLEKFRAFFEKDEYKAFFVKVDSSVKNAARYLNGIGVALEAKHKVYPADRCSVSILDKSSPESLFLGDLVECCMATQSSKFYGLLQRLLDLGCPVIVARNSAGAVIGATWGVLAQDCPSGGVVYGVNFIELASRYAGVEVHQQILVRALTDYTCRYARSLGLSWVLFQEMEYGLVANVATGRFEHRRLVKLGDHVGPEPLFMTSLAPEGRYFEVVNVDTLLLKAEESTAAPS